MIKVFIDPVSKPRMTRRDKWAKRGCVLKYHAFCDQLRLKLNNFSLSNQYEITFAIPFPKSYTDKKKLELRDMPHCSKPDLDNLLKAFNDALLEDDSAINKIHARKIWSDVGFIEVNNIKNNF